MKAMKSNLPPPPVAFMSTMFICLPVVMFQIGAMISTFVAAQQILGQRIRALTSVLKNTHQNRPANLDGKSILVPDFSRQVLKYLKLI